MASTEIVAAELSQKAASGISPEKHQRAVQAIDRYRYSKVEWLRRPNQRCGCRCWSILQFLQRRDGNTLTIGKSHLTESRTSKEQTGISRSGSDCSRYGMRTEI